MKEINNELNKAIKKEVAVKKAIKSAVELIEIRKMHARSRIEYLKDKAALEKDCYF